MINNWIVTIGREYCSGGAEIGHKVAEYFGVPYYDKKIIDATAEMLKINPEIVKEHEEKPLRYWDIVGFKYYGSLYRDDPALLLPLSMRVSDAQFKVIKNYADSGPCVFVGRCADYVLEGRKNVLNVFIYADMEIRIAEAIKRYDISESEAKKLLKRTDKIRASYYNGHSYKLWGERQSYDICINSGKTGIEGGAQILIDYIKGLNANN